MQARFLLVTLVTIGAIGTALPRLAAADRRPVAVVDLAFDPAAEKLAKDLERALNGHPDLSQLPDSTLSAELIGVPADDDQRLLADATASLTRASEHLASFEFQLAGVHATEGETALLGVTPSLATARLADLAFVLGRTRLGESKAAEALEQFQLVQRLGPGRVLDPAQYLPEEIQAFQAAGTEPPGTATLSVKGSGRIWVDGRDRGPTGVPIEIAPGLHVVWVTGPDRETRGRYVRALPGTAQAIEIEDAPASDRLKVRRARLVLRAAPDATARSSAMTQLAALLGVHDAVLITSGGGDVLVQTWRDRAPGFSARRPVKGASPRELLAPLAPAVVIRPRGPTGPVLRPLPPRATRWYRKRWVQASVAGVLAAMVGSIVIVESIDSTRGVNNPTWTPGTAAR